MSLYDDAAVALIAEGAAGKDGVLYNIKPEEKLKATELITGGSFDDASEWTVESGVSVTGGKAVFDGTSGNIDIYQDVSDLSGKTVKVSFTISDYVAGDLSGIFYDSSGAATGTASANGNFSFIKTIGAGHNNNVGVRGINSFEGKVDNFSVKEVEQKPLDFTFTRGSNLTATRVGPDGLIEKGRENLITYSNDFSEWGINTDVYNTPTAGHTGYDGSTNAWLIDRIATDNSYVNIPNNPKLSYTGVFTWSIYAKNESGVDNAILMYTEVGQARFDLTGDGAVLNDSSVIESNIEKIGSSGWFRCSFTASGTINADSNGTPRFRVEDLSNNNAVGKVYVQDSQLEAGLVATEYIDSPGGTTGKAGILEDSPRFDYTDVTCPHLLMEPTRANKLPHSEYFGTGAWVAQAGITLTTNTSDVKSPEGLYNATKVVSTDALDGFYKAGLSVASDIVHSIYLRGASGGETVVLQDSSGYPSPGGQKSITLTDEWVRYDFPIEYNGTNAFQGLFVNNISVGTIYAWGAQMEEGAYATSYIPNHGTSAGVTRDYDTTDSLDFGDYMDGDDVTLFVDLAKNPELIRDGGAGEIRLSSSNKTAGSIKLYRSGDTNLRTVVYFADVELDNDPSSHIVTDGTSPNIAIRRVKSTGEFTVFYDGSQQYQAFNTNYDVLDNILIRGDDQPIFINSILLFDRALTDDECKALAT